MEIKNNQDQVPSAANPLPPKKRNLWLWFVGGVVTLCILLASLLLAVQHISSPIVIDKIQQAVARQSGIELSFQSVELSYFPRPGVSLRQVDIAVPEFGQGKVAEVRLFPAVLPLFVGDLRLASLMLEQPELTLHVPSPEPRKIEVPSSPDPELGELLAGAFAILVPAAHELDLVINDGHVTVDRGQSLINSENLYLDLVLSAEEPQSLLATLKGESSALTITHNGQKETLRGAVLNGSIVTNGDAVKLMLKRLAFDEPRLALSGTFGQDQNTPRLALELTGKDIDVDATRRVAMKLAGDITPIEDIFAYLRGGEISQIVVRSQGGTLTDLGNLKNLRIEGDLKKGAISIPQIELDLIETVGKVLIADGLLQGTEMSTRLEGSSGHDGTLKIGLTEDLDLFQLELMLNADLAQARKILDRIVSNQAYVDETSLVTNLQGSGVGKLTLGDSLSDISAKVDISALNFTADYQRIPFPIKVEDGKVEFSRNSISVRDWRGSIGDSLFSKLAFQANLAGSDEDVSQGSDRIGLELDGTLEEDLVVWLSKTFSVPDVYAVRTPLLLTAARIGWQKDATNSFKGEVSIKDGPGLTLDVDWQEGQLSVHKLNLKDRYSDAVSALDYSADGVALNFSGVLQHETLDAMFVALDFGEGRVEGDFSLKSDEVKPVGLLASGDLQGTDLLLTLPAGDTLAIDRVTLSAKGSQVDVDLSKILWRDRTWDPVKATIDFSGDKPQVTVAEAKFCGLDAPGLLTIDGQNLALDITVKGKGLDLSTSYTCLTRGRTKMTGTLNISSKIKAQGPIDELVPLLEGPLEMTFSKGTIEQGKTLARILEVLNVTEIVKGRLPNLNSTAFAYTSMSLLGNFQKGKLLIHKLAMDGETLDLLGEGEIDLVEGTLNVQILAAPFQTVDTVIKMIPGVNYLMAGSLVAIPVSVKGTLDDPKVKVLSASSVGSSLMKLGERTIKSPLRLIEALTPGGKGQVE